ncbi:MULTISPECIES: SHOCT domain-containing protein [Enterococcus]|uniref:SHOCT domain-containing protein n=1 Tax=Candidatus Enterococcus mangumiae TaxID=2230878 RepID=A0ABZ2SUZ8_9ENTE|nr:MULTISPECIES: SHOCT domain-containing protein [unclassified Enterococcus]MBO0490652.1 SHOCT domain-containing protein [Enterococcus sp. DIV1094]MBO1298964.1 SHOCT domain-containing protein [Enterococcus sp. DIV1271a]
MNIFEGKFGTLAKRKVSFDGSKVMIKKNEFKLSDIKCVYYKTPSTQGSVWNYVYLSLDGEPFDGENIFLQNVFTFTDKQTEKAMELLSLLPLEVIDQGIAIESIQETEYSDNTAIVGLTILLDYDKEFISFLWAKRNIPFDNILDFEIVENGQSKIASGAKAAAVGTVLFGPAGMITGAIIGKGKEKELVDNLYLEVSIKDEPPIKIEIISKKVRKDSKKFRNGLDHLIQIAEKLQPIVEKNNLDEAPSIENIVPSNQTSVTDELRAFKSLLDDGIITQEEFDLKKAELLSK